MCGAVRSLSRFPLLIRTHKLLLIAPAVRAQRQTSRLWRLSGVERSRFRGVSLYLADCTLFVFELAKSVSLLLAVLFRLRKWGGRIGRACALGACDWERPNEWRTRTASTSKMH